jgi:hypothetical protein
MIQKSALLATAEIGLTVACATAVFAQSAESSPSRPAVVHKAVFKGGASSTGWIDFDFYDGKTIFIPAKINGHNTTVLLVTGLPTSNIDKAFAASIGLQSKGSPTGPETGGVNTTGLISGLQIQIGDLTLRDTTASAVDFAPLAKNMGHPLPFLLGDDAFNELAVDIDFAHHRIAFSDPASQAKPGGAVEVPLIRVEDLPLDPVSIEGAPPAQFEMGLGNSAEILVYQSYYESQKLLEGRRMSQRFAGGTGGFTPETVATLRSAKFAGLTFANMPAAFVPTSVAGTKSKVIAGDMGLPVLARFRLIVDYSHDRLYALPYAEAMQAPFAKDRLGLALKKKDAGVVVEFVAPDSPAQAAGFKVGDEIALIDGKSAQEWPQSALADLKYGTTGTSLAFTMEGGGVRRITMADFF